MSLNFTEQEYRALCRRQNAEESPMKASRKRPPTVVDRLPTTEGELKKTVQDYLDLMMNQGALYYDRLNSGELIAVAGESRRRIVLCRPGTADFFLILPAARLVFVELKSQTGSQQKEQKLFQELVTKQGVEYYVVRELEELRKIVEG